MNVMNEPPLTSGTPAHHPHNNQQQKQQILYLTSISYIGAMGNRTAILQ